MRTHHIAPLAALATTVALAAEPDAATPTAPADQSARIAALENAVSQLMKEKGENWLTEQRASDIRQVVQDVLADTDTRASLQGTQATSGQRTAAWNAAPVVGRVVPRVGPLLGVVPDASRDVDITDLSPLVGNGEGE